eukprot:TRINITY_DN2013_c0_g1_i4.p1 TRINITY_DN2013_c0_g1~~TRINITY_DN2013_c0_g1_i4.p1  ORF type:complete len:129 (-),score=20.84 TRINITY_DN2013_c0_g1_i4:55-441(-)
MTATSLSRGTSRRMIHHRCPRPSADLRDTDSLASPAPSTVLVAVPAAVAAPPLLSIALLSASATAAAQVASEAPAAFEDAWNAYNAAALAATFAAAPNGPASTASTKSIPLSAVAKACLSSTWCNCMQ